MLSLSLASLLVVTCHFLHFSYTLNIEEINRAAPTRQRGAASATMPGICGEVGWAVCARASLIVLP